MTERRDVRARIQFGRYAIHLPGTRLQRTILGIALCIGGVLGFLPVLGFWMLPLGLMVLAVDFHPIRRLRRRWAIWWGRKGPGNGKKPRNTAANRTP